jgi:hypothetical protein
MTNEAMSRLRRRMIEDMTIRNFGPNEFTSIRDSGTTRGAVQDVRGCVPRSHDAMGAADDLFENVLDPMWQ